MTGARHFLPATCVLALACQQPAKAEGVVPAPAATRIASESGLRTAVFAGGCFWGIEGVFSHVKGVSSAVSGYHGGAASDATYDRVSAGGTRHAEAVRVTYDPALVRYDQLLRIFFSVGADPTQLNRQGPDVGRHYRTAIIPQSEEQRSVADSYLAQLKASGLWKAPIVARIEGAKRFFPAESYHQDFMLKNPRHGYILRWDAPKIAGLRKLYPAQFRQSFQPG